MCLKRTGPILHAVLPVINAVFVVHVCFKIWYNVITFVVLFTAAADEHAVSSRGQKLKSSRHSAITKGDFVQYCLEL